MRVNLEKAVSFPQRGALMSKDLCSCEKHSQYNILGEGPGRRRVGNWSNGFAICHQNWPTEIIIDYLVSTYIWPLGRIGKCKVAHIGRFDAIFCYLIGDVRHVECQDAIHESLAVWKSGKSIKLIILFLYINKKILRLWSIHVWNRARNLPL